MEQANDYASAIFKEGDRYYMCCSKQELDEVRNGGAFWVTPRLLGEAEALEFLAGREPADLPYESPLSVCRLAA